MSDGYINPIGAVSYTENAYWNKKAMIEKKDVPCMDCGLRWHPMVMTLDHKNRATKYVNGSGKRLSPNQMLTYDPMAFKQMLSGLDPVCMNCHRIREERRDKTLSSPWWKAWSKRLTRGALISEQE